MLPNGLEIAAWWSQQSGLNLTIETADEKWEDKLVALGVAKPPRGGAEDSDSEPELLLIPLPKRGSNEYSNNMSLGGTHGEVRDIVIFLPQQEWDPRKLEGPYLADAVVKSIKRVDDGHSKRAWERVLSDQEKLLPQKTLEAVHKAA